MNFVADIAKHRTQQPQGCAPDALAPAKRLCNEGIPIG